MTSPAYQVHLMEEEKRKKLRDKTVNDKPVLVSKPPIRKEAIYIDPYLDMINKRAVESLQEKIKRLKEKQNANGS